MRSRLARTAAAAAAALLAAAPAMAAAPRERPMVETCLGGLRPLDIPARDAPAVPDDKLACHAGPCTVRAAKKRLT